MVIGTTPFCRRASKISQFVFARRLTKINTQIAAVLQLPEVREQFSKLGISPVPMKPEEFGRFVREQIGTFQKIVKQADIQPL